MTLTFAQKLTARIDPPSAKDGEVAIGTFVGRYPDDLVERIGQDEFRVEKTEFSLMCGYPAPLFSIFAKNDNAAAMFVLGYVDGEYVRLSTR